MPDWYREALVAKYQFSIDLMESLRARRLWKGIIVVEIILFSVIAFLTFGKFWFALLIALFIARNWHQAEAQKRFIIGKQILEIEAEWYEVRENVVFPGLKK